MRRVVFYAQYRAMFPARPAPKLVAVLRLLLLWLGPLLAVAPIAASASGLRILAFEPVVPQLDSVGAQPQRKALERPAQAALEFDAFGQRFKLELERNVRVDHQLSRGASAYRGALEQNPRSWVRLTDTNGRIDALIWNGAELYVIAPGSDTADALVPPLASPDGHLIFRLSDTLIESPAAACATGAADSGQELRGDVVYAGLVEELAAATLAAGSSDATRQLHLSVIADSLFRDYAGSEQNARDDIAARLNNVDGIFTSQLDLRLELASLEVHDGRSDPLSTTTSPSLLLRELGQLRRRDAALRVTGLTHLFTGRDFDGDAVGVAYIDAVCDPQLGAAITELRGRTTFFESLIAAHEIGHNLGAPHDGEEGPCLTTPQSFLMAPRINGNDAFSSCSLREMESRLALAACVEPLPVVDLAASSRTPTQRTLEGGEVLAEFSVRNLGDGSATRVMATVAIDHPGLEVVDAVSSRGTCSASTARVTCSLGDLAADTAVDVTVRLLGTRLGRGTATLSVESVSRDANVANDTAAATVSVEAGTDLAVGLDAPDSSEISREFEITIDVSTRSTLSASDVVLTTTVASGLTIATAASPGGQCSFSAAEARCEHASIDAGRRVSATVTARATAAGNHRVESTAGSAELDLVPADNSTGTQVAVAAQAGTGPTAAPAPSSGGGGLLSPWLLCVALLLSGSRRFSRTA